MVRRRIHSLSPSRWRIQLRAHLFPLSTRSYFFPNRRNLLIFIIPLLSNSFHVFTTPKMKTSIVYMYVVDHDGGKPKAMIVYFIRTTILCLIMAIASETDSASLKKIPWGQYQLKQRTNIKFTLTCHCPVVIHRLKLIQCRCVVRTLRSLVKSVQVQRTRRIRTVGQPTHC
jgi:hypothetical protein